MAQRSVTLKDVARAASVSEATVSRVLHPRDGVPPISPATRELVRRAAADLGYRANQLARGLSRNHTDALGVLLPVDAASLSKPYNSLILAGIGQAASARGFSLSLYYAEPDARQNDARAMRDGRVDGGLVIDSSLLSPRTVAHLAAEEFPIVLIGHRLEGSRAHFVAADDRGGAALTRHLLALGHRRVAHVHYPAGHPTGQRRLGFLDAMAEAARAAPVESIVVEDPRGDGPDTLDRSALLRALLDRPAPPTAIFAWNDVVAAAIIQCAAGLGARVPADLSVVGYNDFPIAQLITPPLTTVHQPLFEMGRVATEALIATIERRRAGAAAGPPLQRVLPAALVVRQSAGPPPARG